MERKNTSVEGWSGLAVRVIDDQAGWLTYDQLLRKVMDLAPGGQGVDLEDRRVDALRLKELQTEMMAFRLEYKFGMDEVLTKINILREEFEHIRDYSPIEHVRTRLKSMESLLRKVVRTECPPRPEDVRDRIRDIAGIRIVCAFVSDAYWIAQMLGDQPDLTVIEIKDYIANPKPNGYQSLHMIVRVPVFLSDRTAYVYVELQIRTIAMDFWASLEHKIYYKFDREVPEHLLAELRDAATVATELDARMARLREEVNALDG